MPRNSIGVYTLPVAAFVSGTIIVSADVNADYSDIASTLTLSLATTGVSTMTGPLKAAGGTLAAPSSAFANELDSGRYLFGIGSYVDVINGAPIVTYTAAGVAVTGTITSTGSIAINTVPVDAFVAGTKELFFNTAAPLNWTKDTTFNNGAIKLVSGTVNADGGSLDFSTVFSSSRVLAANQMPNTTISMTDPTHRHTYPMAALSTQSNSATSIELSGGSSNSGFSSTGIVGTIDNTARGGVVQQGMPFGVKYAEAIRASKN